MKKMFNRTMTNFRKDLARVKEINNYDDLVKFAKSLGVGEGKIKRILKKTAGKNASQQDIDNMIAKLEKK